MGTNYVLVGWIGLANLSVLCLITLYRFFRWYIQWDNPDTWSNSIFRKRFCFHILLFLAPALDLPMYISFILIKDYDIFSYAFHKMESFCIVAALSITISDWSTVLHDIHEYDVSHFFLRKVSLICINVLYAAISIINFITCFAMKNIDDYVQSNYYVIMIFLQIGVFALLTLLMLHAGNKLYNRISGAAGGKMIGSESSQQQSQPSKGTFARLQIPTQFFRMINNGKPVNVLTPKADLHTQLISDSHNPQANNSSVSMSQSLPQNQQSIHFNSLASSQRTTMASASTMLARDTVDRDAAMISDPFDLSTGYFSTNSINSSTLSTIFRHSPFGNRHTMDSNLTSGPALASATLGSTRLRQRDTDAPVEEPSHFDGTAEFRNALRNLNFVMLACTVCVLLQLLFTVLNYALGYANTPNRSPGPYLLFWTCYSWIPLWGPIIALLLLSRSQSTRRKHQQMAQRMVPSMESQQSTSNPLAVRSSLDYHFNNRTSLHDGIQYSSDTGTSSTNMQRNASRNDSYYRSDSDGFRQPSSSDNRSRFVPKGISDVVESDDVLAMRVKNLEDGVSARLTEASLQSQESGHTTTSSRESGAQTLVPGMAFRSQSQNSNNANMGMGETFSVIGGTPNSQSAQRHTPYADTNPLRSVQSLQNNSNDLSLAYPQGYLESNLDRSRDANISDEFDRSRIISTGSSASDEAMRIILGTDSRSQQQHMFQQQLQLQQQQQQQQHHQQQQMRFQQHGSPGRYYETDGDTENNSMQHSYRDTMTTGTHLPSELFFPQITGGDMGDFSYRGEELENGTFLR